MKVWRMGLFNVVTLVHDGSGPFDIIKSPISDGCFNGKLEFFALHFGRDSVTLGVHSLFMVCAWVADREVKAEFHIQFHPKRNIKTSEWTRIPAGRLSATVMLLEFAEPED